MADICMKSINTIRTLAIDAIDKANSGHPGLPLGAAPAAYVLFRRHMTVDIKDPLWINRDRFVLSAGHGSALLYSVLHLMGYEVSIDDLKQFRQWDSITPGHPEFKVTPGVDATTGPLGQGIANAVGMAMAERRMRDLFNKPGYELFNHMVYTLVGDGCLMEGVSAEASSLAGHLGLGNLIVLYDANNISLDGPLDISFTENVAKRYEAYGFQVLTVDNGDTDIDGIDQAIAKAKAETAKPSLIIIHTTIGYASPKAGTSAAHGAPLGNQGSAETKRALGCDPDKTFFVSDEVYADFAEAKERGRQAREAWDMLFFEWQKRNPEEADLWEQFANLDPTANLFENMPDFDGDTPIATRSASSKVINHFHRFIPFIVGGDADLSCSTKTGLHDGGEFTAKSSGANIHYGVREHAMGAIANGIAYYGGLRPFTATFFSFADYMRPPIRMAALSSIASIFVFTHDSLAVGEDGPTHQPIEQLASLRVIPRLVTIRPSDATETAAAWAHILSDSSRPYALILSRQNLPVINRKQFASAIGLTKGAYELTNEASPDLIIIATGSEVSIALEAHKRLRSEGISARVISMPSMELFREQSAEYREQLIPSSVQARIAVEAGVPFGWKEFVGDTGVVIAVNRFGMSAPGGTVMEQYGFTAAHIVEQAKKLLK